MKKISFAIIAAFSFFLLSCEKNIEPIEPQNNEPKLVQMTFNASVPGTRTAIGDLSEGQYSVTWSEGDRIRVIAVDDTGARIENDNEIFDIDAASVGSENASFTGTTVEGAAAYYAVYPATLSIESYEEDGYFMISGYANEDHKVKAVANGFDMSKAAMVATANGGQLAFNHAVSFFKITVAQANIKSIKFYFNSNEGNARIWGNPIVNPATGEATDKALGLADKNKNYVILEPESGTFQQNKEYYVPFASKKKAIKTPLLISFTSDSNFTVTKKTSKLQGVTLENGTVYDLGTPPVSFAPTLNLLKNSVINIPYTAAEGLVIENAYKLSCCTDDDVTVTYDETVITDASISNGSVTYSISANDTEKERTGYIFLQLGENEALVISITQLADGMSVGEESYVWNFTEIYGAGELGVQLKTDMAAGTYSFTNNGKTLSYTTTNTNDQFQSSSDIVYLRPNGNGSKSTRYFTFDVSSGGTLTISASSNKAGESMTLHVLLNDNEVQSKDGGSSNVTTPSDHVYSLTSGGSVVIYADNKPRYFELSFSNQN